MEENNDIVKRLEKALNESPLIQQWVEIMGEIEAIGDSEVPMSKMIYTLKPFKDAQPKDTTQEKYNTTEKE